MLRKMSKGNSITLTTAPGAANQRRGSSINNALNPELNRGLSIGGPNMMKRMSTRSQAQLEIAPTGIQNRSSSNFMGSGRFYASFGSGKSTESPPMFGGNAAKTSLG